MLVFAGVVPALAGWGIMLLWNNILVGACGFAAITLWQGAGLFLLGQLLSSGFMLGLFILGGVMHMKAHHPGHRMRDHWGHMTDEQRREFFMRRRSMFGFNPQDTADGSVNNG